VVKVVGVFWFVVVVGVVVVLWGDSCGFFFSFSLRSSIRFGSLVVGTIYYNNLICAKNSVEYRIEYIWDNIEKFPSENSKKKKV